MILRLITLAIALCTPGALHTEANAFALPQQDIAVISAKISQAGKLVSSPVVHVAVGNDASVRQSLEIDGKLVELEIAIRVENDPKQAGGYEAVFVYRLNGDETTRTERWARARQVQHAIGTVTVSIGLSTP